ncbi:hypothetical protein CLV71_108147 [Actinophytocola oryzae]|uniref:Uncharacterized protein n=1 Tax=Actinophytocola oryzae TaxID=502181 RepID=A0A4R7VHZ3_9PSEU|nr:hypothetical protein CLV71_108147 [Actinophytocola oryzae]
MHERDLSCGPATASIALFTDSEPAPLPVSWRVERGEALVPEGPQSLENGRPAVIGCAHGASAEAVVDRVYEVALASSFAASRMSFAVSMARQYPSIGKPASRRCLASSGKVERSWSPTSGSRSRISPAKT